LSEDSLEDRALALIKSRHGGILQSDLWKDLGIDSRKCSRVIAKLEADGKIKRTWETVKGTRTYRISYLPQKKEAPRKEVDFSLIMAGGEVAPCIGCTYECEPDYCPDLGNWIELLARVSARELSKAERGVKAPEVRVKAKEPEEAVVEEEVVAVVKGKKAPKAAKAAKEVKTAKKEEALKAVASKKSAAKPEAKAAVAKPSKTVKGKKK
jgi:DNA-binding MarR family transcriptional regulator